MTRERAKSGEYAPNALENTQRGLTVDLIMTSRNDLQTCRRDETASSVNARNEGKFSFLPVVDQADRFLGLYRADRWFSVEAPNEPIGSDFEPFSEAVVIGADASIIDFVQVAHKWPARFVVSGDRIEGLVTQADLQELPVRAALFTLITNLEIVMAQRIEAEWIDKDPKGWLKLLRHDQRKRIKQQVRKAKEGGSFVSEIVCSHLGDKADILVNKRLIQGSKDFLEHAFDAILGLRNSIAHANYYARSRKAAEKTCKTVRLILRIQEELSASMGTMN